MRESRSFRYGIALAGAAAARRPAPDLPGGIGRAVRGLVFNNLCTLISTLLNYILGLAGGTLPIGL